MVGNNKKYKHLFQDKLLRQINAWICKEFVDSLISGRGVVI